MKARIWGWVGAEVGVEVAQYFVKKKQLISNNI